MQVFDEVVLTSLERFAVLVRQRPLAWFGYAAQTRIRALAVSAVLAHFPALAARSAAAAFPAPAIVPALEATVFLAPAPGRLPK